MNARYVIGTAGIFLLILCVVFPARLSAQEIVNEGRTIFLGKKCSGCHSVESAGVPKKSGSLKTGPPDLSAAGARHTAAFFVKYLQKRETINKKKHLLKFTGSDGELQKLAEWLESLKGKTK